MIVGTHTASTAQEQVNLVLRAGKDLDFSLRQKAERMRQGPGRGYRFLGFLEQIILEVDQGSNVSHLEAMGGRVTGRSLRWIDRYPILGLTIPEEDLIFTQPLPLRNGLVFLPDVPDPRHVVNNPYKVDRHGQSHLKEGQAPEQPRKLKQLVERIASAKSGRFLVFHPIAQILVLLQGPMPQPMGENAGMRKVMNSPLGRGTWGAFGSHRMPLSSLTGFDNRKMALLVDPYTGEAYFTGGRYQMQAPDVKV